MEKFLSFFTDILIEALGQTIYMVGISTILATLIGFILAIILVVTDEGGLQPNKIINSILGFIVNTLRSFPFIILVVAIIPLTRAIVGKSIGETAALVPLTIGSAPFIARVIEGALKEVDKGLIEAAKSFGASNFQIIFKVMVKEAMPSIISGITLSIISIIGYSAMAGAVGAGGVGAVALTYGYQRFDNAVMIYTVITLIIIVQLLQGAGNLAYRKLK
ncbi:MAG: methionine ABC transporter permease [Clostridium celatum]|uniref:methionine ABC transporter permease n=1 Tax=Clostridium sp. TaxID=1506 RepID=UPI0025BDBDA9|nr:methionine ABC transporter permease [Clostridium sp.]MBS4957759.1 ABC transporter permease [Clostridium sp.]MDU4884412.1 methionine ABC transporter permease [Clostridium celatum]MDU5262958.1 methionine ABC transporter permease [Clostridium celatum]MDU7077610.1 methionine ABC transporter permease [Clostridium celatum]